MDSSTVAIDKPNIVSMKSGLEGRNNAATSAGDWRSADVRLNEVRPRRPEQ